VAVKIVNYVLRYFVPRQLIYSNSTTTSVPWNLGQKKLKAKYCCADNVLGKLFPDVVCLYRVYWFV